MLASFIRLRTLPGRLARSQECPLAEGQGVVLSSMIPSAPPAQPKRPRHMDQFTDMQVLQARESQHLTTMALHGTPWQSASNEVTKWTYPKGSSIAETGRSTHGTKQIITVSTSITCQQRGRSSRDWPSDTWNEARRESFRPGRPREFRQDTDVKSRGTPSTNKYASENQRQKDNATK